MHIGHHVSRSINNNEYSTNLPRVSVSGGKVVAGTIWGKIFFGGRDGAFISSPTRKVQV